MIEPVNHKRLGENCQAKPFNQLASDCMILETPFSTFRLCKMPRTGVFSYVYKDNFFNIQSHQLTFVDDPREYLFVVVVEMYKHV